MATWVKVTRRVAAPRYFIMHNTDLHAIYYVHSIILWSGQTTSTSCLYGLNTLYHLMHIIFATQGSDEDFTGFTYRPQ